MYSAGQIAGMDNNFINSYIYEKSSPEWWKILFCVCVRYFLWFGWSNSQKLIQS